MQVWEARVYVRNGYTRIQHTVRLQAETVVAAQQLLGAQYGPENVISVPVPLSASSSSGTSPWIRTL